MNCERVRSSLIEYREGALCVADEITIDLHLLQCQSCQLELDVVDGMKDIISHCLQAPPPETHTMALMDELEHAHNVQPPSDRPPYSGVGLCAVRVLATALIFAAIAAGFSTWGRKSDTFSALTKAQVVPYSISRQWRPWLNESREVGDLDEIARAVLLDPEAMNLTRDP